MKHLFVPYDIALMAKEKKFNEECCTYFLNQNLQRLDGFGLMNEDFQDDEARIAAPLYQQLINWFRDEHKILIRPEINGYDYEIIMITNFDTLHRGFDNIDLALRQAFELI